jgi:type IV pilus assembly protein PilB
MPSSPNPSPKTTATSQRQEHLAGELHIPSQVVEDIRATIQNIAQLQERLTTVETTGATEFIQILLVAALTLDASDIHIEPEHDGTKFRIRIDGMLHDIITIPPATAEILLSRIKLTSGLKLNVADKPQDGRFSFELGEETTLEARVASLPAEYGESLVLRVLNPKNLIGIDQLGLRAPTLASMKEELKKPNGMIITTGPTGSGKTTTLYAFLKELEKPEIKIITIEDPIEYHLTGISQTQVNTARGYDFASGLQAIVRQDPDVLLVGEIRDQSTAQIALQAALTGHLVFSTLHANDAPGTISRLVSLKANPVNIGSALNVIIGQRLARKVCSVCATQKKATPSQIAQIKKGLQGVTDSPIPTISQALTLSTAPGCPQCNNTGYKGRAGLFEIALIDSAMEELILTKPSTSALRKFAIEHGMTTMYQDGLFKVLDGITTLKELERVTGE